MVFEQVTSVQGWPFASDYVQVVATRVLLVLHFYLHLSEDRDGLHSICEQYQRDLSKQAAGNRFSWVVLEIKLTTPPVFISIVRGVSIHLQNCSV